MQMRKSWRIKKANKNIVNNLTDSLGVSKVIAELLALRGITNYKKAKNFFRPDLSHLHNPFLMKGMMEAINRINTVISNNQKILLYGDYDVDGTTSVAMMYTFFSNFTDKIDYYIPCRYNEGYGISYKGIDYAKENNISLIISLDCGIRAVEQIDYAKKKGIDFIICDHHNPANTVPNAIAILNPKQNDCNYPFKDLSGCGVAFKLIQGYCEYDNIQLEKITHLLDFLVVSIAADIVPMVDENRVFSFFGLNILNSSPRVGIKALMDIAKRKDKWRISDIVFGIAPRINAAGRLKHGKIAVELLIEEDNEKAMLIAARIEKLNLERRNIERIITEEALKMVNTNKKSTVVYSRSWHKGVVGICASRLIESYYKPTIVLSEKDGILTGSARSVKGFDLYSTLKKCEEYLERFGGHMYAAGLSLKKENLNDFILAFEEEVSKSITDDQLIPVIQVDSEIRLHEIDAKLVRIIKQFAPFGPKNNEPVLMSRDIKDSGNGRLVGNKKEHLRLEIIDNEGKCPISGIGFGLAQYYNKIIDNHSFDICYIIDENIWNGKKELQLKLKDIKSAHSSS